MSKRPPGGPDSYSEGIAGWNKHAGHFGDSNGDGAISDEGDSRAAKRSRVKAVPRRAIKKVPDDAIPHLNYKNAGALKELAKFYRQTGPGTLVQIDIPAQNLTSALAEVKGRHLWGTDIYTDDSNLVCALMHCGYYNASLKKPVAAVAEMNVVIQLMPPQQTYPNYTRNGIRPRAWWVGGTTCSYKIEQCSLKSRSGERLELPRRTERSQALVPTFTPSHSEKAMNTRGREASAERRQRRVNEVSIIYSLSNEPWIKYNMAAVADWGLKPSQWTSARLVTQVMLLETLRERYELSLQPEDSSEGSEAQGEMVYRFAKCRDILALPAMQRIGLPMPEAHVDVIHHALPWEQLKWSDEGLDIQNQHYYFIRLRFAQHTSKSSPSPSLNGTGDIRMNGGV